MHESWRDVPISQGKDGRWQALADVGHKPNGQIDRRHRSGKTKEDVEQRLRELFKKLNSGRDTGPGRAPTVRQWWTEWLTDIAPYGEDALAPTTLQNYWSKCRKWIFPNLGELRLPELESPTPIRGLYKQMRKQGASDSLLLQVHAVIRRGLAVAVREQKISRNGAALMSRPGTPQHRRDPLPNDAVGRILTVVSGLRLASRWEVGLGTGCRQGEALGLDWDRVDLDDGYADMSWQLTRVSWRHGCDNPYQCADHAGVGGRSLHRKKPCARANRGPHKGQCAVHTSGRGCPQLCGRDCDRHASRCPQRVGGGLVLRRRKSWDPKRPVPHIVSLPPIAVQSLREWRVAQDAEREAAGNVWRQDVVRYPDGSPADLVWRQPDGAPLDPRADWEQWSDILVQAEVPHVPLHTGRHTAATMLLDLGIDLAVVQEELGHKHISTTRIYGHVRQTVTGRAAVKLGEHMDKLRRGAQPEELTGLASVTSLDTARRRRRAAQ